MSKFIKKDELQLVNGGYLADAKESPVNNTEFVQLQREAEYLVTLAGKMKGKDFKGTKAASIDELIAETKSELNADRVEEFISQPAKPKRKITDQLTAEAQTFVKFHEESAQATKVNDKLQPFKLINEFETFGLFFTPGIVKLNKIYTMDEIKEAASVVYTVVG